MGVTAWEIDDFARVELALESRGWQVEHCAHCDRSSRHPSCRIVRIPLRVQEPIEDILDYLRER